MASAPGSARAPDSASLPLGPRSPPQPGSARLRHAGLRSLPGAPVDRFLEQAEENSRRRQCRDGVEASGGGASPSTSLPSKGVRSKYMLTACLVNDELFALQQKQKASPPKQRRKVSPRPSQRLPPEEAGEQALAPWVVSSPVGFEVAAMDGSRCHVPCNSWLALECAERGAVSGGELSADAGGGYIVHGGGSALIKRVPDERVTARAAEANLRRAVRGSSTVALRHAAFILKVTGDRRGDGEDGGLGPHPEPEAKSASDLAQEADESLVALAVRMRRLVESRHCHEQSTKQALIQKGEEHRKFLATQCSIGPDELEHLGFRSGWLRRGLQAYTDFQRFMNDRYGSAIRGWLALNPEGTQGMGEKQFARALERVGFRGSVAALWRYLDRDSSRQVTLVEVAPKTSRLVAGLKTYIQEHYDNSIYDVMRNFDHSGNGHVSRQEFIDGLRDMGYPGPGMAPAGRIFDLLVTPGLAFIRPKELQFLDGWDMPPYLCAQDDSEAEAALKESLSATCKNFLEAWINKLDPDRTMRVSWHEFTSFCRVLARSGGPRTADLANDNYSARIWRAWDDDCSGYISLREFDLEAFAALSSLKRWANTVGGILKFMRDQTSKTNEARYDKHDKIIDLPVKHGKIETTHFKKVLRDHVFADHAGSQREAIKLLCDALEQHNDSTICLRDLAFIDKWDLEHEELEAKLRRREQPS